MHHFETSSRSQTKTHRKQTAIHTHLSITGKMLRGDLVHAIVHANTPGCEVQSIYLDLWVIAGKMGAGALSKCFSLDFIKVICGGDWKFKTNTGLGLGKLQRLFKHSDALAVAVPDYLVTWACPFLCTPKHPAYYIQHVDSFVHTVSIWLSFIWCLPL